jgi:phage terminase large subunit GpA-like protein
MIRSTPACSPRRATRSGGKGSEHDGESTLSLKMFPGGFLALGGANTPNTFARRSVRIAMGDDVDRFPAVVGEEGDPADLLVNRTTTFYDALVMFVSTPTLKGGRIDTLYERSDKRQYRDHVPGLRPRGLDHLARPAHFRVAFDDRDPETARLVCPGDHGGCGAQMTRLGTPRMVPAGGWRRPRRRRTRASRDFICRRCCRRSATSRCHRWSRSGCRRA